jgi:hypothetical protein
MDVVALDCKDRVCHLFNVVQSVSTLTSFSSFSLETAETMLYEAFSDYIRRYPHLKPLVDEHPNVVKFMSTELKRVYTHDRVSVIEGAFAKSTLPFPDNVVTAQLRWMRLLRERANFYGYPDGTNPITFVQKPPLCFTCGESPLTDCVCKQIAYCSTRCRQLDTPHQEVCRGNTGKT